MSTHLVISRDEDILFLTFESNDGYPRLESAVLAKLSREIGHLAAAPEIAGCVITGSGRAFAAGAEISELTKLTPSAAREFALIGQRAFGAIAWSQKPVIAAIRGYCMGGGLDLALACHARIATPDAVFAHPGGALGILTGWGGTQRLPRLIGGSRALEMLVTGRKMDANEAFRCGLMSRIVESPALLREAAILDAARKNHREIKGDTIGRFHARRAVPRIPRNLKGAA